MVAIGHTAVGAVTGLFIYQTFSIQEPILGLTTVTAAGIASHYLTDIIPHGHFVKFKDLRSKIMPIILYDVILGGVLFLLTAALWQGLNLKWLYILFAIGGAQLPDILDVLIYLGVIPNKGLIKLENALHIQTHWHGKFEKGLMMGKRDIWQFSVIILSLIYLITNTT